MRPALVSLMAATAIALCACATNTQLVTRLAAESTDCNPSAIEVSDLGQHYAGINDYQTSGCGITHKYECPKGNNIVMASVGLFNLDQRRCRQVTR